MSAIQPAATEPILIFEKGLPGFEACHRLTLVDSDETAPFSHLVNVDDPQVSFVVTDPFYFFEEYECVLPADIQDKLAIKTPQDVMILVMVIVSANPIHSTVNLMAPLVINRSTRRGMQFVMHDSPYSIRTPLFGAEAGMRKGE